MRYIADSNGYLQEVSFGADIACGGDTCTEYTGSVPADYTSLEAWYLAEADKLYRWKVVDGELTLDSSAVAPIDIYPGMHIIPVAKSEGGAYSTDPINWYMVASHTIWLKEKISEQKNGIVLLWSRYTDNAAQNNSFNATEIPKTFPASFPGSGISCQLSDGGHWANVAAKYLYINDNRITGYVQNGATGTGSSGIKYANNAFVLRYVYGF